MSDTTGTTASTVVEIIRQDDPHTTTNEGELARTGTGIMVLVIFALVVIFLGVVASASSRRIYRY
jgi:uncharacterized membrane protein